MEEKPKKRKTKSSAAGETNEGRRKRMGDKKKGKSTDSLLSVPGDDKQPPAQPTNDPTEQKPGGEAAKEEEYDNNEEDDLVVLDPEYEKYLRVRNEEAVQQMRILLEKMTPEQQTRYETYRSTAFPKGSMKKIMQQILGQNIPERMAIMVAGVAKLHLGQLVETALDVKEERGGKGALKPEDLREADRRISKGSICSGPLLP